MPSDMLVENEMMKFEKLVSGLFSLALAAVTILPLVHILRLVMGLNVVRFPWSFFLILSLRSTGSF